MKNKYIEQVEINYSKAEFEEFKARKRRVREMEKDAEKNPKFNK